MLQVIYPVAFVGRAMRVNEHSLSIGHVLLPLSLVHVSRSLRHLTLATHHVVLEGADVGASIRPNHLTHAVLY